MCLSPEVDLVASAAIGVVAVDALRHCPSKRALPLALLPAVFAVHTATEVFVWWGIGGDGPVQAYLWVAYVLLPVLVPVAVLLVEPVHWRRNALVLLVAAGSVAALDLGRGLVAGGGTAQLCTAYVRYDVVGTHTLASGLYLLAVCGALLLASDRLLRTWGLLNVAAVGVLLVVSSAGLPSLWCLWAACSSVLIARYLRAEQHAAVDPVRRRTARPTPA